MSSLQGVIHGTNDGYSNHGCRCDACTEARSSAFRAHNTIPCPVCGSRIYTHGTRNRQALALRGGLCGQCWRYSTRVIRHGTETGYTHQGCRCDDCRTASADARRRRRLTPNVARHGSEGYRNGCRCDVCRSGYADYSWRRRGRVD